MSEQPSVYEQLGGEAGIRRLVQRFYQLMDTLPETRGVRALHPGDLTGSEEKLFAFLSGWTGGPALFVERFGPPMLRRRHFPFEIGISERDQWMLCMRRALDEHGASESLRSVLEGALGRLADHMRNRPG